MVECCLLLLQLRIELLLLLLAGWSHHAAENVHQLGAVGERVTMTAATGVGCGEQGHGSILVLQPKLGSQWGVTHWMEVMVLVVSSLVPTEREGHRDVRGLQTRFSGLPC